MDIIREENKSSLVKSGDGVPTPLEIYEVLNDYVIGQDHAKKVLSVAVHNHYKRLNHAARNNDVELAKSNILLIGPTGCGKTLLAQTLARILDVPFTMADATTLTEAGYVGEDVENIILKLLQVRRLQCRARAARHRLHRRGRQDLAGSPTTRRSPATCRARACSRRSSRSWKAPSPACLRRAAASIRSRNSCRSIRPTSSSSAAAPSRASTRSSPTAGRKTSIGFGATVRAPEDRKTGELFRLVEPEDLLKFGLIPEFVGRLPVVATLEDLDEAALVQILTEPKNALVKQYQRLFEMENVELNFHSDALTAISKRAIERKTGARGLRSIMEAILLETMFDLPGLDGVEEVVISADVVNGNSRPLYIYGERAVEEHHTAGRSA